MWRKMSSTALTALGLEIVHDCLPVVAGTTLYEVVSAVVRMFVISCHRTISINEVMDVAVHLQCKTSICFQ
jgi:hypothetical protein